MKLRAFVQAKHRTYVDLKVCYYTSFYLVTLEATDGFMLPVC